MIYFITTSGHTYTIGRHLQAWGRELVGRVQAISYRRLLSTSSFPHGIYVFADIERLGSRATSRATELYRRLRFEGSTVLNDPGKVLLRTGLLRSLHDAGVNRFRCFGVNEPLDAVRFPVFLRCANDHRGSRTGLIDSAEQLKTEIANQVRTRFFFHDEHGKFRFFRWGPTRRRELLITEFCDTADSNGIYRKYSAFSLAGRIVPRHLFFGTQWMLKAPELFTEELIAEERKYVISNPHATELREIFATARIDYGRIDYGLHNGKIQVWEINTNPMITHRSDARVPERVPVQEEFSRRLSSAFRELEQALLERRRIQQPAILRRAA